MNIDVVLFKTFGDILMGTAVIHAIKQKYPDSYIRFYTEPGYRELLEDNPEVNEVIPAVTYADVYSYIYQHKLKSDHICRLAMANHYDTCWHHNPETSGMSMFSYYAKRTDLPITLDTQDMVCRLYNKPQDIVASNSLSNLPTLDSFYVVHTTSLLETKNYPIAYFNRLVQLVTQKYNIPVVQVGGPKDTPIKNAINYLGTRVKETKYIIDNAKFFIGIDSGCSYIAGASGKPTFLLMGSTTGKQVGPVGDNVHYIEAQRPNDPHCQPMPCVNHCALGKMCIENLTPEIVFDRIQSVIKL